LVDWVYERIPVKEYRNNTVQVARIVNRENLRMGRFNGTKQNVY
jgi:hypothetical protein